MNFLNYKYYKTLFWGVSVCLLTSLGHTACTEVLPGDDLLEVPLMGVEQESEITRTSATLVGNFTGNLSLVKKAGVKYSTSNEFPDDKTFEKEIPIEQLTEGSFSIELTGLSPNTKYYYCWFVSTGGMTVDSYVSEFTTPATEMTTFGELVADTIGEDMARISCNVAEVGDNFLIECGIAYKKKTDRTFISIACDSIPQNAEKKFAVDLMDLEPNTQYIIRAYAKNSADESGNTGIKEGYSENDSITTQNQLSATMSILEPSSIGSSSAKITAKVLSAVGSDGVIEERGFCYSSTNTYPTIADGKLVVEGTALNEDYTGTITGLEEGTDYYVRAYAKSIVEGKERYGYSEVMQFKTIGLETPSFEDLSFNTSATEIEITAIFSNYDENAIVERGFIWDKTKGEITLEEAVTANQFVKVDGKSKTFTGKITGLKPNESYYVRAYAIYKSGDNEKIGYSWRYSIGTAGFNTPSLDGPEITEVSFFSAKLTGRISSNGNGTIIKRGFCISTKTSSPTIETSEIVEEADESFVVVLDGLKMGTNYYVRSYVIAELDGEQQTVYSYERDINTPYPTSPNFYDLKNEDVIFDFSSITISAEIMDLGDGESLVEKGFCWIKREMNEEWKTLSLETCDGSFKSDDLTKDAYTYTISGLSWNTEYAVKAYAKVRIGDEIIVGYSSERSSFTQSPELPTFSAFENLTSTFSSITLTNEILNLGDGEELIEKGICWLKSNDWVDFTLENCTGSLKSEDVTTDGYTYTITNLMFSTSYKIRAYAKVRIGDEITVNYSNTINCGTNSISVSWGMITVSDTSCEVTATFQNDMTGITEYGLCASEEELNGEPSGKLIELPVTSITDSKQISGTITGLASGKKYYIWVYAKSGETVGYSWRTEITTKRIPGEDNNVSPDKKD